jgi:hypothetical protein
MFGDTMTILKHWAPVTQCHDTTSKKNRDLNHTTAEPKNAHIMKTVFIPSLCVLLFKRKSREVAQITYESAGISSGLWVGAGQHIVNN